MKRHLIYRNIKLYSQPIFHFIHLYIIILYTYISLIEYSHYCIDNIKNDIIITLLLQYHRENIKRNGF